MKAKDDPWAAYGGIGGELVALLKKDLEETKCCGLIVLPGTFTRLAIARLINEAVLAARKKAFLGAAKKCESKGMFRASPACRLLATEFRKLAEETPDA